MLKFNMGPVMDLQLLKMAKYRFRLPTSRSKPDFCKYFDAAAQEAAWAGSSYTLRITDHGKPAVDYIIKKGEVTAIHHYIYKNQKNKN